MTSAVRRVAFALALLGTPVLATACAATSYDSSIPSDPTSVAPSTLPAGPAAVLLPRMVETAGTLSMLITTRGDKTAVVEQVQALWNASQQEVAATRPELLGNFEANVKLGARAAKYSRAADADKAYQNLRALVASYLGTG